MNYKKKNYSFSLNQIENVFVTIGFLSFIFFWGLKINFDLRLFIVFPVFFFLCRFFKEKLDLRVFYFPLLVIGCVILHLSLSLIINKELFNDDFLSNYYRSILPLFIVALAVSQYFKLLVKNFELIINIFISLYLLEILIIILKTISLLNSDHNINLLKLIFNCDNGLTSYSGIVFHENSHLAMISVPLIFFKIIKNNLFKKKISLCIFIIFIIFNYLSYSTTFHVGIIASGLFSVIYLIFRREYKRLYLFLPIILFSILIIFFDKTCRLKLNHSTHLGQHVLFEKKNDLENKPVNLTSEVHYYGLLVIKSSLKDTNFIGAGFNNYEILNKLYRDKFTKLFFYPGAVELNSKDASSNLIKIISEFGLFVFFLVILFLYFIFKSTENLYISVFLISAIVTQLIRGAGYFNGGFILFALMICYSVFFRNKENKND
jgi:hypothetical protein